MPFRTLRTAVTALLVAASSIAFATPLPASVEAELARARLPREALAAWVAPVDATQPLLAWQADRPVNPASLTKLLTTSAALDLLGPAWTWTTPVWLHGTVASGVLDGNLVIKGSGDPKLVLERIWLLLRRVQQLGVREIRGDIVLDRSAFVVPEGDPAEFDGEALRPYNVRPDALLLNYKALALAFTPEPARGVARVSVEPALAGVSADASVALEPGPCGDWRERLKADFSDTARIRFAGRYPAACAERSWSIAYADARRYNERALAGLWQQMGGRLDGSVRDGTAPETPPSFEFASPPLADVVRDINKYSNNVMAQQLFLTLGLTQRGTGTPEAARAVLQQWLQRLGPAETGTVIDNGSGLSRETRISARLFAQVLQAAWAGPAMPELMASLPLSGADGTLRRSTVSVGRAHLKTGSLRDVAAVAGYVLADSGRRYVVVAIVNDPNAGAARGTLDALLQWVASQPAAAQMARQGR